MLADSVGSPLIALHGKATMFAAVGNTGHLVPERVSERHRKRSAIRCHLVAVLVCAVDRFTRPSKDLEPLIELAEQQRSSSSCPSCCGCLDLATDT
jgi:hypothetical protein